MAVTVTTPSWTGTKIANNFDLGTRVLKWVRIDLDMNGTAVYDWTTGFDYVLFAVVSLNEVAGVGECPCVYWNALNDGTASNGSVGITAVDGTNNTFHAFACGF